MNVFRTTILTVLFVGALAGCGDSQPWVTDSRLDKGLVMVLPGIEGRSPLNENICEGLAAGGVESAIRLEDWTFRMAGPLYNLRAEPRNRDKAAEIARHIDKYKYRYPDRPVVLVGQSGGAAMAAWIAESLPASVNIDGIIMLQPSLSPQYYLDWALKNTKRGIINFHSRRDWLFLGVGTTVTGTMDGEHESSAGRTGFDVPQVGRRRKLYEKLYQVSWSQRMAEMGHTGGHLSSSAESFVSKYIAPLVRAKQWNDQILGEIIEGYKPNQQTVYESAD